ncbi:hypothetical protein J6590_105277, partial [Homalodisca vitripennis]
MFSHDKDNRKECRRVQISNSVFKSFAGNKTLVDLQRVTDARSVTFTATCWLSCSP